MTMTTTDNMPFTAAELDDIRRKLPDYLGDQYLIERLIATIDSVTGGTVDISPEEVEALGYAADMLEMRAEDRYQRGVKSRAEAHIAELYLQWGGCAGPCTCGPAATTPGQAMSDAYEPAPPVQAETRFGISSARRAC